MDPWGFGSIATVVSTWEDLWCRNSPWSWLAWLALDTLSKTLRNLGKSWDTHQKRGSTASNQQHLVMGPAKELIPPGAHPPDVLGLMPPGLKPEKAHLYKTPSGASVVGESTWLRDVESTPPALHGFYCQALSQPCHSCIIGSGSCQ